VLDYALIAAGLFGGISKTDAAASEVVADLDAASDVTSPTGSVSGGPFLLTVAQVSNAYLLIWCS